MNPTQRPRLEGELLDGAANFARIELSPERKAITGPVFDGLQSLIDVIDRLELGDAPPESTFDPRWEA